jgi:hypothetical protein
LFFACEILHRLLKRERHSYGLNTGLHGIQALSCRACVAGFLISRKSLKIKNFPFNRLNKPGIQYLFFPFWESTYCVPNPEKRMKIRIFWGEQHPLPDSWCCEARNASRGENTMKNTFGKITMLVAVLFSVSCAISEPATTTASPLQAAKKNFDGSPAGCLPGLPCIQSVSTTLINMK